MANAKTEERKKAEELIHKFIKTIPVGIPFNRAWEIAKQCAFIAVDEILKNESYFHCVLDGATEYWEEVKQEIEKL